MLFPVTITVLWAMATIYLHPLYKHLTLVECIIVHSAIASLMLLLATAQYFAHVFF